MGLYLWQVFIFFSLKITLIWYTGLLMNLSILCAYVWWNVLDETNCK